MITTERIRELRRLSNSPNSAEFCIALHESFADLLEAAAENLHLKFALEQKSKEIGRSEHRGNTVDYIYDKLENYSRQLLKYGCKVRSLKAAIAELIEACDPHGLERDYVSIPIAAWCKFEEVVCSQTKT